jgi:hypothetical protein
MEVIVNELCNTQIMISLDSKRPLETVHVSSVSCTEHSSNDDASYSQRVKPFMSFN